MRASALSPAFSPKLSGKVATYLNELGVTVREGARATAIDRKGVKWRSTAPASTIPSRTVVWAAGVHAVLHGCPRSRDRREQNDRGGRIEVSEMT